LHKKQAELAEGRKGRTCAREAYRQKIRIMIICGARSCVSVHSEELQRIMQIDEPGKVDQVSAAERAQANAQRAADTAVAPLPPEQPKILDSGHRARIHWRSI